MKICTSVLTLAFILSVSAPVFAQTSNGDGTASVEDLEDKRPEVNRAEANDDRDERRGSRAK